MTTERIGNTFICEWEIENFLMWDWNSIEVEFLASNLDESRWSIGMSGNGLDTCIIKRCQDSNETKEIFVDCRIEIICGKGNSLKSFTMTKEKFEIDSKVEKIVGVNDLFDVVKMMRKDTLNVICTLESCKPLLKTLNPTCCRCKAKSKIRFDRLNLSVSALIPLPTEPITFFTIKNVEFAVNIFPIKNDILVTLEPQDEFSNSIRCQICLLDVNGIVKKSIKDSRPQLDSVEEWTFQSFFSLDELQNNKELYLKNNNFTLNFELIFPSDAEMEESVEYMDNSNTLNSIDALRLDLLSMFKTRKHADVQLTAGDDVYPAHKSLLSARSPVFSAMFDQDMRESQTGTVDCSDLDSSTLEAFLEFLYTGTAKLADCASSLKLMMAADKYGVLSLVEECAAYLKSVVCLDNVCQVAASADLIGHKKLKDSCFDFIVRNADSLLSTEQWLEWVKGNIGLSSEILCKLSVHMKNAISEK